MLKPLKNDTDFTKELGINRTVLGTEILYVRSRLAIICNAYQIDCIDTPFTMKDNPEGLLQDCNNAKNLGLTSKCSIHPNHVDTINSVFAPNQEEIIQSLRIVTKADKEQKGAFSLDGREVVQLRGYPNQSLSPQDGNNIYNKFSLELRYPISLKPSASVFALSFLEAGNGFDNFKDYSPFDVKRSAGIGVRVFMPAFGLLGIDFGYGFDSTDLSNSGQASGWQTHFVIGQQF